VSRPRWFVALIRTTFPHRFLAARLTRLPIVGAAIDRLLLHGDQLVYLPLDNIVPVDEQVELAGSLVLPSQVVDHFIEQASTHWIMNTCLCRESAGCQDYPVEVGCLFLGEAAAGINPKLGRPVSKDEARAHVQRARDAGLVHLVGRNKLDTVWLGVGPGQNLLTICHCCPCCCLWGILPHMAPELAANVAAMPGVDVRVTGACTGCGLCTAGVCFVDAIHLVEGRAKVGDGCRGCGRCVDACPQQAIELLVHDGQYVARTIATLSAAVDVGPPPTVPGEPLGG
jgi:ferredoxin